MLLEGIFVPLTTPFYPDGRPYYKKLEHNVARYSLSGIAGMLVLGQTGEAAGLSDDESRQVLHTAITAAAKEKVMIAGVGRDSVFATLSLAEIAAAEGYDAIAVRAPEFSANPSMAVELLTYFRAVADRSPLPVVLTSESERPLPLAAIAEMAAHPQVVGLIEPDGDRTTDLLAATSAATRTVTVTAVFAAATGRMLRHVEASGSGTFVSADSLGGGGTALAVAAPPPLLKTRTKQVGFQVMVASAGGMLAAWQAGAVAAVAPLAACAPQACCEVWQAFKDGDLGLAAEKQERVQRVAERMQGTKGVGAVKHACDLNGYFGGRPRLPLLSLTAEDRAAVERELSGMRH